MATEATQPATEPAATAPTASDWPIPFLLDEAWLRSRRLLVQEMERRGLWPRTAPHVAFMQEQRDQGRRLAQGLLGDALGPIDFAHLNSESIYGPANRHLRERLPYVLSFGYELGAGLHALLTDDAAHRDAAAELGALFNLGISLFDLIYDHFPALLEDFGGLFNDGVLRQLADEPQAERPSFDWESISSDELRVLLRIISAFFERLHALHQRLESAEGRSTAWERLRASLLAAYQAEQQSAPASTAPAAEAVEVARRKSTLPFQVIYLIAALAALPISQPRTAVTRRLADDIGLIFWLTDDLVDIVPDFQTDALNALLAGASGAKQPRDGVLTTVLDGDWMPKTARDIGGALLRVRRALEDQADGPGPRLWLVVACYTRNWME